jgi:hypothetical protein
MTGQAKFNGVLNSFPVQQRQSAGMTKCDGRNIGIGLTPERSTVATEQFARC